MWDGVKIWDVESGNEIRCLKGDYGEVESVDFDKDGKRIASGIWCGEPDNNVILWDVESGKEIWSV